MAHDANALTSCARTAVVAAAALMLLSACNGSDRIGEWKKAEIREACFGAMERAHDNTPALPTRDHRIGLMTLARGIEMKTALHCYVVTNERAICNKHNRAYIVDYVGRYFRFVDDMYRTAEPYGPQEKRTVDAFWDDWRSRAIRIALESHIKNGRLNADDFGWSRPTQLTALLDKYKGAKDWCPKA